MEAGGGLEAGHVFARLDAKLEDRNFRRFDAAVDRSRAKTKDLSRDQDKLARSTSMLSREQQRHVQVLRSQGHTWASVAEQIGVNEDHLRSWNSTARTTVREQEKIRKSTRDTDRQFSGLDGAIARVNRTTTFFGRTLRLLKWPAMIAGAGAALQGVNALTGGVVALVSALAPLSGLLVAVPAALGTFGQALGVSLLGLSGVKDAVKALNSEQAKSGATAEDAAKKQRSAASSIRSAEEQLGDAQRGSRESQRDLNKARHEAVESLQDMRNAAISARLGEQGAQLSLRRAIVELHTAQADPKSTALDIEELQLRVREARQQSKEARLENRRAQAESRHATGRGVKGDPGVLDALRSVADAERDVLRSKRAVLEAERDGQESMAATSSAVDKVAESFAEMNPEQQKFARFIFGLKPRLQDLQQTAAKGLLPGVETGMRSALKNFPMVNRLVGGTSRVLGNLAERAGKLFGSKGFGRDLETVGKGNARTLGLMGRASEHLFKGLANVMVAAQPFLRFLGKYTNHLSAWIEKSTEVNRKNGDLEKFFGRTEEVVNRITSIFQSLGATLHVIGEEAAPLGREILEVFDEGAEGLEKWSESTSGRKSIGQYFKDARGPLWEAGRLVRDIVKAFFELGDGEGMESIEHLLHQIRVELLPVFTEMMKQTTAAFGPHLVELLTAVLGLFGRLAGASGPLTIYTDSLTAAAEITNFFLDTIPGLRGATTNLIGFIAVLKTFEKLGKWTGITKGLEMAFGPELGSRLRGKLGTMLKGVFLRGALALNLAATWGAEVAGSAAKGIGKQIGKFRAVARRAAVAFIGVFAPEIAAGMAAGGRLGEVLTARFPKLAGRFKGAGKMAGKAFIIGFILAAPLIGYELGKWFGEKHPELTKDIVQFGTDMGEWFVNAMIAAINGGIKAINFAMDKANVFSILGVDAPEIPEIKNVQFTGPNEARREQRGRERKRRRRKTQQGLKQKGFDPGEVGTEIVEPEDDDYVPGRRRRRRKRREQERDELMGPAGSQSGRRPEDAARDTRKKVTEEQRKMRKDVDDEGDRMRRNSEDRFDKIRKGSIDDAKRMGKGVSGATASMAGAHDRSTRQMLMDTDNRFAGIRDIASERSDRMASDVGRNMGEMARVTDDGTRRVQAAVVKALKAFGVKDVDLGLKGDGSPKPKKAASGGVFTVPGQGLQDNVYLPGVHALVAPGEDLFAANRHQQPLLDYAVEAALGVRGGLDGFFAAFNKPHYMTRGGRAPRRLAGGGFVDPSWDPGSEIISRSIAPSVRNWTRRYKADITAGLDQGHLSPGHTVTGTATDVVPMGGWSRASQRLFEQGLRYLTQRGFEVLYDGRLGTVSWPGHGPPSVAGANAHAHIEWVGNGTAPDALEALGAMMGIGKISRIGVTGKPGTERTIAQLAIDRTRQGANAFIRRKTGGSRAIGDLDVGGGVLTEAEFLKVARAALRLTGHGGLPGGARKLLILARQESSLNPNSINLTDDNAKAGIPSQGLMQIIPPNFRTYHEPKTSWDIKDPLANIAASINYQFAQYGGLVTTSPYARGGRLRRLAGGGRAGVGRGRGIAGIGPGHRADRPHRSRAELGGNWFAGPPTGKYSPESLLAIAASTGVALPYALLRDGVPNWRGLPVSKYAKLVNDYLRSIGEYRTGLGEERRSAEESFPANPMLTSVTALSANTIAQALGYHPPMGGEVGVYGSGYAGLGNLDAVAEGLRGQIIGTYSEEYLRPYEERRSAITAARDRALAVDPEKEAKDYAKAKLKGLANRTRRKQKEALKGSKLPKAKRAKVNRQIRRAELRRTRADIAHHGRVVRRRAGKRGRAAEARYEELIEGVMDPVDVQREELEKRYQYETERREEFAPLLSEIAANVQRTALVGSAQSRLFSSPSFARGGRLPGGSVSSPAAALAGAMGAPRVMVPLSVRLSGAMEALNPHIQAIVDGRVRDLGQAAGERRATVSAPGRKVSYGGS